MKAFVMLISALLCWQTHAQTLTITSPDFENGGEIPERYTCDGDDTNPNLNIAGLPKNTKSIAIIVEDPDVALATFNHWLVWNIPPQDFIRASSIPGIQGNNSIGKNSYLGPCPPAGTHRYFFKVYALDTFLDLEPDSNKRRLEAAMKDHVLAEGEIHGVYNKK